MSLPKPTETSSAKILVVDDDGFMRMQLRVYLQKEGHRVELAENGQEALAKFAEIKPEVVLLDALMPVMDGFACCQALMDSYQNPSPLVLMITGLDDEASVDRAFEAGAIDYVTKPIHWAVLRQRVKRLLYQSRLQYQLESANQMLERLAKIDQLTQLANRRQLELFLDTEWSEAIREQYPFSVLLCDIDYFKNYNDYYGHQGGDSCLQKTAVALAKVVSRPKDLAARYGGEEFLIALPNTDLEGAVHIGEQIRREIAGLHIPHAQSAIADRVTLSIGCASTIPPHGSGWAQLVAKADKYLYQAKAEGRNRLVSGQLGEEPMG
ncbi:MULTISPECIES: PleD family two-component system response regulator [unclassified Synechocystis]|uniref:response regulator n=1 Tax=unclassified Synechocystis TaxID=2640012 RepID=UPI000410195A|nr:MULTISPECIES: PleD family two-component system response regulator [unclassified Synechocystis]AIE75427.1 Two-component response regulator [Synechocystis sp. PCC 6714]MCT0253652.1 PleD family two-component system response regulator [Synechocystis sp. CS-94]